MLYYTGFLLLIIAVSMDGFGVGMTYGMQKTKVPFIAIVIIMGCSGVVVLLSMLMGDYLKPILHPGTADLFGGVILISLGVFSLVNLIRSKKNTKAASENSLPSPDKKKAIQTVFSAPEKADLDQSGIISSHEAVLLGVALAMDAFGAGIGAAMLGYPPLSTALSIALLSGMFLLGGIQSGLFLSRHHYFNLLSFLPALLLIFIGLFNIW